MISPIRFIKSLIIRQEGTQTPREIEITPGGNASTRTVLTTSQTANRTLTLPDNSGTIATTAGPQTITGTTIDADDNTITNIDNDEIRAGAAIDATKIADGSVTNTEFQYINTVTSNVQDQLDAGSTALTTHINDTTGAHAASAISVVPTGNLSSTDAQSALVELQTSIDNLVAGVTPEVRPQFSISATGTLPDDADVVYVDTFTTSFTITLPANPQEGQIIKLIGLSGLGMGNEATVVANAGQVIDGITLPTVRFRTGFSIRYEGTAWVLTNIYQRGDISGYVVGTTDGQVLTNKTIDTQSNTINATGITSGYVLTANGSNGTAWAPAASTALLELPPVSDVFVAASGIFYPTYYFVVSPANATAGATYQNGSFLFIVTTTIAGGTLLRTTGSGTPPSSGTLTKTGGTGDNSITFTASKAPSIMMVEMVGGGGGGGAGNLGPAGTAGGDTGFGALLAGGGGGSGVPGTAINGGAGGTSALFGNPGFVSTGGYGTYGAFLGGALGPGGNGGSTPFGAGGPGRYGNNVGGNASSGSGAGGGGGGGGTTNSVGGNGGGAGGYLFATFSAPYTNYGYATGSPGTGGGPAAPGHGAGGNGAFGSIRVLQLFN